MPQLRRSTCRLLKTVAGKPHASSDDHEDEPRLPSTSQKQTMTKSDEDAINADPISSDDEESARIPIPAATPPASTKKTPKSTARKSARKPIIAPKKGAFGNLQAEKGRQSQEEEKENRVSSSLSLTRKRKAEEDEENSMFGWEHKRPTKMQRVARPTSNIHAQGKATYGSRKNVGAFGSRGQTGRNGKDKASSMESLMKYSTTNAPPPEPEDDDSDLSDVSMTSTVSLHEAKQKGTLRKPPHKKKYLEAVRHAPKDDLPTPSSPTKRTKPSLLQSLGRYRGEPTPDAQVSDRITLDLNRSGSSTPLSSLQPDDPSGECLQLLEQYAADLPGTESEDRCPLCDKSIDIDYYRSYWRGKKSTVRNQQIFCREHTKHTALAEYKRRGYPEIDWSHLPSRIAKHHPLLESIIRNEHPSHYRDIQAENVADRQTGRKMQETNVSLHLTQTGYYGSRGSRAMMETITDKLAGVIREYEVKDRVVASAGMANFVLRVLVPELTIRLVMEDYKLSERSMSEAEEIVKKSGELGAVVNEELRDEVLEVASEGEEE